MNGLLIGKTLCQEIQKPDEEILDGIKEEMGIFLGKEEFSSVNVASEKRSSGGDDYWLADTGSQIHVAKADHAMKNETKKGLEPIFGCDGGKVEATKKGDLWLKTAEGTEVELKDVRVVPGVKKNIISVFQLVEDGWEFHGNGKGLTLRKDSKTLNFLKSSDRNLCYLKAKAIDHKKVEVHAIADEAHDDDDDDDYGDMPALSEKHDDDDSDSDDEEEEEDGVWNYMTRTWSDVV